MSKTSIPKALRRRVYAQGRARCGYCLAQEDNTGAELDVDHIIPEAAGGGQSPRVFIFPEAQPGTCSPSAYSCASSFCAR